MLGDVSDRLGLVNLGLALSPVMCGSVRLG